MGQPVCSCDLGFSGGNCEDCDAASGHYDDGAGGCLNPVDLRADSRLVLWLDATSTPMISIQPESTDRVAVWRDRSGLNHDASSVEEARPIYRSGAGFSHIAFSDQTHLEISSQFTAGTVFVVARYDRHPDFFQENAGLFSGSGSGRKRIYFTGEKDTNRWLHLDGGGMQRSRLDEKFVNGQNPADLGAMNTHEITVSLQDFAIYSGTDSAPIQDSNWFLGVDRDVDGDGWRGSVAELLVYDVALEPVDRLRVERYLNVKYEIY
jgi:hypothetical protein